MLRSVVSEFDDESVALWDSLKKSLTWESRDEIEISVYSETVLGMYFSSLVGSLELVLVDKLPFLLDLFVEWSPSQCLVVLGFENLTLFIGEEFSNELVHLPPSVSLRGSQVTGFSSTIVMNLEPVGLVIDTTNHLFFLRVDPLGESQV